MRRRTTGSPVLAHGRRPVLAALALVTTALLGVVAAAPAEAAGPKYPRVRPIAASADFLIYRQQTANAYGLFFPKGSTLYFIGRTGGRNRLAGFDPQLPQTLQGSTAVQPEAPNVVQAEGYDPALPEHVRWRDLRTGRGGVAEIPAGDDLVGAAPGGWITTRIEGGSKRLIRWMTGGRSVDLGVPLPGGAPSSVLPGPAGVLVAAANTNGGRFDAEADDSGRIRYMRYRTPGSWRTVYSAGTGVDTSCRQPTTTHAVCFIDSGSAKHSGTVLLTLATGARVWLGDHPKACQVGAGTAVGALTVDKASSTQTGCVKGRLTQLTASGSVTTSTRSWGAHAAYITAGLGGILLDTADQRRIVRLSSVRGTPHTVVTAR